MSQPPPNSTLYSFSNTNGTRPVSSTGMASIPCTTTPRRNTSRQEWVDNMTISTQNYNQNSRPQTVMSPTEQIGTRMLPSATSQYGTLNYSTLNSRKSVCSTQPFPMAFEAQTPTQTPGPSAFTRVHNANIIGTTSSYGMHPGMTSQMSIPFSPITVPDFRHFDQSPVTYTKIIYYMDSLD